MQMCVESVHRKQRRRPNIEWSKQWILCVHVHVRVCTYMSEAYMSLLLQRAPNLTKESRDEKIHTKNPYAIYKLRFG